MYRSFNLYIYLNERKRENIRQNGCVKLFAREQVGIQLSGSQLKGDSVNSSFTELAEYIIGSVGRIRGDILHYFRISSLYANLPTAELHTMLN